jgi:putative RNA 2'-phosphotransferase
LKKQPRSVRLSKLLSLVLRHRPERIGLELDANGWAEVEQLLARLPRAGVTLERAELDAIVRESDKRRFALSDDGRRIRASQGHSIEVELGYPPTRPPARLFHGTAERNLAKIREHGIHRGRRHHVHLSATRTTAESVGRRHGKPIVLVVDATRMHAAGHVFFISANGVWLVTHVPPEYIDVDE